MSSRDKDQTTPHHQPLISSLVVRPTVSDGGGEGGGRGGGSDYEPGEVRREPPTYYRSDRYSDEAGYRNRAGSASPPRRRDAEHRYGSDFDHPSGMARSHEFGSGRDHGRYRDPSPPYGRGRGGGRPFGRGFDGPAFGPGPFRNRNEGGMHRNNPNVRPREGDWICSDPLCGNLNFARREYCNNCKRHRYAPGGSPRRGYHGPPPPPPPPRRFPGPPLDISPRRAMNGYRSPPRSWGRDGPRDFGGASGLPPSRHEGRISDHMRRGDRSHFAEDDYRGRNKQMPPMDWGDRDRPRDSFFNDRKGYERRPPSPPLAQPVPPHHGRWGRDIRERSRSPIRGGGGPPAKDYRRDMYLDRGRDDRRGMGRDRIGGGF